MRDNQKLYIVACRDLAPGAQAVQGMHALTEFSIFHREHYEEWHDKSNHLCFLSVANESALHYLITLCENAGVRYAFFREPAFGMRLTAVSLEATDTAAAMLKDLPLALK